jgi:antitoxin MazE
MKTKLVQIGNSRGIRLPKPIIEEAGLTDEVELRVRPGEIVIESLRKPRAGWAQAAARMVASRREVSTDAYVPTRFDEEEWQW